MSILELVRHTLVADMPMFVVIRQLCPGIFEFLGRLHRMGIVVSKNAFALGLVQCQRIPNPMRNVL